MLLEGCKRWRLRSIYIKDHRRRWLGMKDTLCERDSIRAVVFALVAATAASGSSSIAKKENKGEDIFFFFVVAS